MSRRIAVIGGSGYLGSVVVPKLVDRGDFVAVIDVDWFTSGPGSGDARDLTSADLVGFDAVINLAGLTDEASCAARPDLTERLNVRMAADLIAACAEAKVPRVVFASSSAVYGVTDRDVPESARTAPVGAYARSKLAAERAMSGAGRQGGPTVVAVRLGTLFGVAPSMRHDLLVNRLVDQARIDRWRNLTSSGSSHRPFVHVRDAAEAFVLATSARLESAGGVTLFNCATENRSIGEVASLVSGHFGIGDFVPAAHIDPASYRIDSSALRAMGWTPRRTIADGVVELTAHVEAPSPTSFRAAHLDRLVDREQVDADLRWSGSRHRCERRAVPLVTPFRLPDPARAVYQQASRSIVERSSYRADGGWTSTCAGLVADSLRLDESDGVWNVSMLRSGTDALVRALWSLGVRHGSSVAVPDFAFHAVAGSVLGLGARPVLVDVTPDTWCLDPNALLASCHDRPIDAIIAVDNYGTPCDWPGLARAARSVGAPLIVDACESLGASRPDVPLCAHADAIVLSFSFTKPIHAAGMGGALVGRVDRMVHHDPLRWTDSQYALPELNGAHLALAWPHLDASIEHLRATYETYSAVARQFGLVSQVEHGCSTRIHAPFLLPTALAGRRNELIADLSAAGVSSRAQFPSQSVLLGLDGGCAPAVAGDLSGRVLSLPSGAGLPPATVDRVAQTLAQILSQSKYS